MLLVSSKTQRQQKFRIRKSKRREGSTGDFDKPQKQIHERTLQSPNPQVSSLATADQFTTS